MRRLLACVKVVAACLLAVGLPATALAQGDRASIAGLVTDTTGAVLPGVTVEASSPVLIEQSRTAITDGSGRYAIIDLRPGTYAVAFELQGFNKMPREAIELEAAFAAQVNASLSIGAVAE